MFLSEIKVCLEPTTVTGGGRSALTHGELRQQQLRAPRGAHSPSQGGGAGRSPGLAPEPRPSPPEASRRSLRSPPSSPRRAGRGTSTKTPTSERARAHPANSWPRPGPRSESGQQTLGRQEASAGGLGPGTEGGGPKREEERGRGPGVTQATRTSRMAEKRVSKNRERPA